MDDPPSCAAGRVKIGAFWSGEAGAAGGVLARFGSSWSGRLPDWPGASDVGSGSGLAGSCVVGAGVGSGVGVLQSIRMGMQNAVRADWICTASCDLAAPSPASASTMPRATAPRVLVPFSVCVQ